MGTQMIFGSGDPVTFLFALVLGVIQLGALVLIATVLAVQYWRQIVTVGCAALALQVVLMYVNSPEAQYERCVGKAVSVFDVLACHQDHPTPPKPGM